FVVETMGRDCGYIALMAGIAGGAEVIALPESEIMPAEVAKRLRAAYQRGKTHALVVIAEGARCGVKELTQHYAEQRDSIGFGRRECGVNRIHARPSNSWTCTSSPASTLPRSCSSTMRQFASDIERSTPEPCWPVVRTFHSPPSRERIPRWYSVLPATFLSGSAAVALSNGNSVLSVLPERCSSASRTSA